MFHVIIIDLHALHDMHVMMLMYMHVSWGVYKQWTGLLEWWNSGMVDWIFLFGFFDYL